MLFYKIECQKYHTKIVHNVEQSLLIKTLISNLVRTTCFENTLHQVRSRSVILELELVLLGIEKSNVLMTLHE